MLFSFETVCCFFTSIFVVEDHLCWSSKEVKPTTSPSVLVLVQQGSHTHNLPLSLSVGPASKSNPQPPLSGSVGPARISNPQPSPSVLVLVQQGNQTYNLPLSLSVGAARISNPQPSPSVLVFVQQGRQIHNVPPQS